MSGKNTTVMFRIKKYVLIGQQQAIMPQLNCPTFLHLYVNKQNYWFEHTDTILAAL